MKNMKTKIFSAEKLWVPLKLPLHVSVHDHHQGAYIWAWLKCELPDDGRGAKHVAAILI
jgi:hypothetical protein